MSLKKNKMKNKNLKPQYLKITRDCLTCQQEKQYIRTGKSKGSLHTEYNSKHLCKSVFGLFTFNVQEGEGEAARYILAIMGRHSRYAKLCILKNILTEKVIKVFEKAWFLQLSLPTYLLTDQSRQFINQKFKAYLSKYNIIHRTTSAYNPTKNNIVARFNQEVAKRLQVLRNSNKKNREGPQ